MTGMTLLGGLPYDTTLVSLMTLIAYILLLLVGDCASGLLAARLLLRPQSFVLVRAGWQRWFSLALRKCFLSTLAACVILLIPGLLRFTDAKTLYAWLLFTLHMEAVAAVQVLLMALFENAMAALTPIIFVQLASLLLSRKLPGSAALLLPGNWGSLFRTKEYEYSQLYRILSDISAPEEAAAGSFPEYVASRLHRGFPLWAAIALNLAVLLPICLFGWRLVRRKHQRK